MKKLFSRSKNWRFEKTIETIINIDLQSFNRASQTEIILGEHAVTFSLDKNTKFNYLPAASFN